MKHANRRHATRTSLLDAAVRVIDRDTLQGFTLEAVAQEAGVSKGGLFYHFESKQALVRGMLDAAFEAFERRIGELYEAVPGGYVKAFVLATIEAATSPQHLQTKTALCAAVASHPELLSPYAQRSQQWQSRLEQDGTLPARATVARLAADGLFFMNLFGSREVFAPQQEALVSLLMDLAQP